MRRLLPFLAKAAVSILLLYLSLRSVDLGIVARRLTQIDIIWIVFVILALLAQNILLAQRWRRIAIVSGTTMPFTSALRYALIAMFFNQTLPSTVGGDAARIWLLGSRGAGWKIATYSVLVDRLVGLVALVVLVIICLPWTLSLIRDPVGRIVLVVIGGGGIAGAVVFLAIGFGNWHWLDRWWVTRHFAAAARIAWQLCTDAHAAMLVMTSSLLIHLLTVTAAWGTAKSVGASFDFTLALFLIPPVILIATVIPVSIAGWGLREGAMIAAFAYAGLVQSDGLTISVLFGAATFVVGAIGGLVWILGGGRLGAPFGGIAGPHVRR